MPLFHRQYQLNSPRLSVARLGLVPGTSCFHLEQSTSSIWAVRHSTHRPNCSDVFIHATHKQTGLHKGAFPPLSRSTACSCALFLLFSIIKHYCRLNTDASIYGCRAWTSFSYQWPAASLRHTKVSDQLSWNLDGGETKKYQVPHFGDRNAKKGWLS